MKIFLIFLLFFMAAGAQAQEGDYTPPPLFAEPKLPPPKIKKAPIDKLPDLSQEVQESKKLPPNKQTIIPPRLIEEVPQSPSIQTQEQNKAPVTVPIPEDKPRLEVAEEKPVITEEPIDFIKKETPDDSGVVTGPKTMPSNKKEMVEEVLLYEEKTPATPVLSLQPAINTEKKKIVAPTEPVEIDQNQYYFTFKPQESSLSNENIRILENIIIPAMLQNKDISIEMNAYAAAIAGDSNADRRIALDRGLVIRERFIENGIESYRINLRSHGSNTTNQPPDYVEINIKGL